MILCDGRADAPDFFVEMWNQRIAAVQGGGLEAIADPTLGMWLKEEFRSANPERVAKIRDMITSNDAAGYIANCEALKTLDYLRHLPKAKVPITYVGGGSDKGAAPEVMREMAAATPGARYIEIPGGHHLPNIDSASAFNAILEELLEV
jgi:3-oxoadipate enol-lactonase